MEKSKYVIKIRNLYKDFIIYNDKANTLNLVCPIGTLTFEVV